MSTNRNTKNVMDITWINFPSQLQSGDTISCNIDGVIVSGIVRFTEKAANVSLVSPVKGLENSRFIPLSNPGKYLSNGVATARGVECAKDLLPGIWASYKKMMELVPEVVEGIDAYNGHFDEITLQINKIKAEHTILKTSLKAKSIDLQSYEKRIKKLNKDISELEIQRHSLFEDTFHLRERSGYGIDNPWAVVEQVSGKKVKIK